MSKKIGALFFFFIMIVAAFGIANFLSITFYEKSVLTVIKDFIFVLTKK
jgi:ABC-type lipoprotein release transport system permease subunit